MREWEQFLTDRDRSVLATYGSKKMGFGRRPVVLVVDMGPNFVGPEPLPLLESMKKWRSSCGEEGWRAAQSTAVLLAAARGKRLPIIYTTEADQRADGWESGRWADKNARRGEDRKYDLASAGTPTRNVIPRVGKAVSPLIEPADVDVIIPKLKPSAFFATMLNSYLVELQADTIITTGLSTSGCVRASVVDGFSYHYRMIVVEEGVADRFQVSHATALLDMDLKYADVVPLAETTAYIDSLETGLFDRQFPSLAS